VQEHRRADAHGHSRHGRDDRLLAADNAPQELEYGRVLVARRMREKVRDVVPAAECVRRARTRITRTASSAIACLNASASATYIAWVRALRFSGRRISMRWTPPPVST
jgi:hypothetical protein